MCEIPADSLALLQAVHSGRGFHRAATDVRYVLKNLIAHRGGDGVGSGKMTKHFLRMLTDAVGLGISAGK